MSEYQYYEFLAIGRPLDDDDQAAVRSLSTWINQATRVLTFEAKFLGSVGIGVAAPWEFDRIKSII